MLILEVEGIRQKAQLKNKDYTHTKVNHPIARRSINHQPVF